MKLKTFAHRISRIIAALFAITAIGIAEAATKRPNILIVTVDDMSCDSLGAFGCLLPDTSPNIDRLAAQSLRFDFAHVQVGNCFPSRNVMWSGRYPHNSRVEGFYQVRDKDYPVLCDLMKDNGYFTGIRGKVSHSTPYSPYPWDIILDEIDGKKMHMKNAESYYLSTKRGIDLSRKEKKPFCLMINISDPHKPFYAEGKGGATVPDSNKPTRIFTPDEVPIPGFLFDDPVVRKELAHYYSSVRRADDCFAATLMALKESGEEDKTFILFLSDHGMPLPFAKTQLYHHSTRTPLMVKWPGVTKGGTVDKTHMVSAVDFLPTLLDVAGIKHPKGLDGRSFAGLIRGGQQKNRDYIIKEYNENAGASRDPMRAVQTKKFLYLFNPWSNGERVMATATSGTSTYRRMKELAATDSRIADRHSLYQHRVVEELFDVENDPDCLVNLIGSPQHQAELARLRGTLMTWMETTGDHMLPVYQKRNDPAVREAYILAREKESAERRTAKGKGNDNPKKKGKATSKKRANLIQLELPKSIQAGKSITVSIPHELPKRLGEQQIHVTLKVGTALKRLDRKVVKVSGKGKVEVTFELPATIPDGTIGFAAFVGAEYTENLQHVATKAIKVE